MATKREIAGRIEQVEKKLAELRKEFLEAPEDNGPKYGWWVVQNPIGHKYHKAMEFCGTGPSPVLPKEITSVTGHPYYLVQGAYRV